MRQRDPRCWLAQFDERGRSCAGRVDACHLLKQQLLRREGHGDLIADERTYKPGCRLHHGSWDAYRGVVVPRSALPEPFLALMESIGLSWAVDRRYGPQNGSHEPSRAD